MKGGFPAAARTALADSQLRRNLGDDGVGLGRVPGPMDHAAGPGDGRLQLLQVVGQVGQHLVLDGRPGQPELLPVLELGDRGQPLGPNHAGCVAQVGPQLGVGQGRSGRLWERRHA